MPRTHLSPEELDELCVNTIRFLAVDAVEKAKSGHPGAPMGLAPIAYLLWTKHLRFDPEDPSWHNRDRFVLSNGHASMLHYALLHLTGFDLSLDEIKNFRQFGSKTPGHPERGDTPGIEVTTGPLGQGFANSVGLAIAEQFLASTFNHAGQDVIDHYTYVFAGDGCMEEGITSEAASLAGHLELGKLIAFYDDNGITIDGDTRIAFTEDVSKRFEAYHWHVIDLPDANDLDQVDHAISVAKSIRDKPTLIICHTHIGYGSPNKQDTGKAHGNPLGKDEVALTKDHLGWPREPEFYIPEDVLYHFREAGSRGIEIHRKWEELFRIYRKAHPDDWQTLSNALIHKLPENWDKNLPVFKVSDGPLATRTAGGKVMNAIAETVPTLTSGAADLNESTFTKLEKWDDFEPSPLKKGSYHGRTINFGVREHAMAAIINGMAAHGAIYPSGSTFFCFSDYMRPSVRLAALMNVPSKFVWTHDSVALGEDGPTHEPIEQLMSLRAMPNLAVIRPADANETVEAWRCMMQLTGPSGIVLTRQKLPVIDRAKYASAAGLAKGAYVISEAMSQPEIILIATGSEVQLALDAQILLEANGLMTRVVSMPCWEFFEAQSENYRDRILPPEVTCRLSIELGASLGWERWVGSMGASLAVDHFGVSAPYETILEHYGFTAQNISHIAGMLLHDPRRAQRELYELQQKYGRHQRLKIERPA
ncbi:MAG: transketolase [Bacteroidota bacterium]|nr:transketolase [Bacteroidota bacterium]MDP4232658.1 transketolase [Bacteroidota bacterium]MDP4243209.1 transketolase [Bacteroidota bacterium]MDP4288421.1 transketolase [Bacteroidota bacterium]